MKNKYRSTKKGYQRKPKTNKKHSTIVKLAGGKINRPLYNLRQLANKVKVMSDLIAPECKFFDYTLPLATIGTNPTAYTATINQIPQGDSATTRTGKSIVLNKLMIRVTANYAGLAAGTIQRIRFAIVYDKKPEAPATFYNTVFQDGTVYSFNDMDRGDRYIKLYDRLITMDVNTPFYNDKAIINMKDVHVSWTQDDVVGTAFEKGLMRVVAVSDQAANFPFIGFNTRLCYFDN